MGPRDRARSFGGDALRQLRTRAGQHRSGPELDTDGAAFRLGDRQPVLKRPHDESRRAAHAYANGAAIANGRTLRNASAHASADARANRRANGTSDAIASAIANLDTRADQVATANAISDQLSDAFARAYGFSRSDPATP
jgi:hypothetical protein